MLTVQSFLFIQNIQNVMPSVKPFLYSGNFA
jgi:hypothetical protein